MDIYIYNDTWLKSKLRRIIYIILLPRGQNTTLNDDI